MAENFRRRFSFRHLSFRKAKKQPDRPKSIHVTEPQADLRRTTSSRQPKTTGDAVRASNLKRLAPKRPSSPAKKQSDPPKSIHVTDSQSDIRSISARQSPNRQGGGFSTSNVKRVAPSRPSTTAQKQPDLPKSKEATGSCIELKRCNSSGQSLSNVKRLAPGRLSTPVIAKKQCDQSESNHVTDSQTELQGTTPAEEASTSGECPGVSTKKRIAPRRPSIPVEKQPNQHRPSFDATDSKGGLKRSKSVNPGCISRKSSGTANGRKDLTKRASVSDWNDVWNKPTIGQALQSFTAILRCDLTFEAGDQIEVLTQTSKQFDWWEGSARGHTGIFPANYIELL
ncbi:drebrin-like protein [Lytechinus variegatus]|uniref:drebrin-like protein n=1 Tax=Lytechinus variegatus TaxID=7654 RepID=UPI001BB16DF9|nr:drebrin-like protein [Lytechinus variegatus]